MANTTLEVILRARDQLSGAVDKVNQKLKQTGTTSQNAMNQTKNATSQATQALKQQETAANTVSQKFNNVKSTVTNAMNQVKTAIQNANPSKYINAESISKPFKNAAESIRSKWQTLMQNLKGETNKLNNTKVGFQISTAGLMTLDGQIATTNSKVTTFLTTLNRISPTLNTIGGRAVNAFNQIRTGIGNASAKLTNLASGLSGVQGMLMSAFAVVGVTSLKSFIIDSAIAREKVNAVTREVAGSEAAFKKVNASIKAATAGTTLGYNNMAKAVNNVALRFHVTGEAATSLAGPMGKIGVLAQAMGKSSEEAASVMEHAFDGLQDKWRSLKQYGITKEALIGEGWSGAADDVEGYAKALDKVLEKNPKFEQFTHTFEYQFESFKMTIKGIGTEIGMILLPILKGLLEGLTSLSKEHPGLLKIAVVVGLVVLALASIATTVLPIIMLVSALKELKIATMAVQVATTIWNAVTKIATAVQAALNFVMSMNPIMIVVLAIAALVAILTYLYFTNEDVRNALNGLWDFLVNSFIGAWEWLQQTFQGLYEYLASVFIPIWTWINDVFTQGGDAINGFITWLQGLYDKFLEVLPLILAILMPWTLLFDENIRNTAISAVQGFISWISQLPTQLWFWLLDCIEKVKLWALSLKDKFVEAASTAVNNFIDWIKSLPGKAWTWLSNVLSKAGEFKDQVIAKLREAGTKSVTYFTDKIKNLPGAMWTELMNIKQKISDGVGQLVESIKNLGWKMLEGFKDALGIHSPGFMSEDMENEMQYIQDRMTDVYSDVYDTASEVGSNILDGFNSNDYDSMITTLEDSLPEDMYGETSVKMNATQVQDNISQSIPETNTLLDTVVNTDMNSVTSDMLNMTGTVNPQLAVVTNSLNQMGATSTSMTAQTLQNNQQLINGYNQMNLAIRTSMTNIQNTNTTGWNNIKNVTTNSLNSMLSSTKSVTAQMVSAWQTMKNSIIQAANDIKTQSSSRFESLWSTIKTFYNRIQHPGGAGSPNMARRRRSSGSGGGFRAFGNAIRNTIQNQPRTGTISRRTLITGGFSKDELQYLFPTGNTHIGVDDVENYINAMIRAGAGGWSSVVKPNVDWIRNKTNAWTTAPPTIINKYKTSKGFKVGDFENGEPNITFSDFQRMAEDVFSQCHYEFYWDSERYGNWIAAFHNGGMNCSDSTDALIAMAHACGLPADKVHGHWNQYGHFWANVAGHKMDTTGWMNQRNWTPSASHAGPVPRSQQVLQTENEDTTSIIDILLEILTILRGNSEKDITVTHEGKVEYEFTHDINGELPDNINEEEVYRLMNAHVNDSQFLKLLTSNREFQERFEHIQQKLVRERERFS